MILEQYQHHIPGLETTPGVLGPVRAVYLRAPTAKILIDGIGTVE